MKAAASRSRDPVDPVDSTRRRSRRLRFELIFASLWLAFGLFLLPALIFWVGSALLDTYGEGAGPGRFYIDFYGDLADGSGRAWTLALGPLLLICLLRAIFLGMQPAPLGQEPVEDDAPPPSRRAPLDHEARQEARRAPQKAQREPKRAATRPARIEPRMSGD